MQKKKKIFIWYYFISAIYCYLQLLLLLSSFFPLEFFTSALVDIDLQEFKWQQVSSSVQDSPQYSGRS